MTCPESCRNCNLDVEFQRFSSGKYRNTGNAKKTIIAQLFICKIAKDGYLENIADLYGHVQPVIVLLLKFFFCCCCIVVLCPR